MDIKKKISRRRFLSLAGAGLAIGSIISRLKIKPASAFPDEEYHYYFPEVSIKSGASRVVHVRDSSATHWDDPSTEYYYQHVDQAVVSAMTLAGLQALTGRTSWSDIWDFLFRKKNVGGYVAGQKIAFKVNFNNSSNSENDCDTHSNVIDALPHPVLAMIDGLVTAGVAITDINIYDATGIGRLIPDYFRNAINSIYPGVHYIGKPACGVTPASHGKHPSLKVSFNDPDGVLADRTLADILYDASYLIDVPIIKRHGGDNAVPATLSFKNHLGSLNAITLSTSDSIHHYIYTGGAVYDQQYSPLVDIWNNPNIRDKTILIAADALYGAKDGVGATATHSWNIAGGDGLQSLLFAMDPVAVDCVMIDMLRAEGTISSLRAYDYLFCAEEAHLGYCEGTRSYPGGKPLQLPYGSGYDKLIYQRLDL